MNLWLRTGDKQEWSYLVFLLNLFDRNIFCIFLSILLLIWVENSEYFLTAKRANGRVWPKIW